MFERLVRTGAWTAASAAIGIELEEVFDGLPWKIAWRWS